MQRAAVPPAPTREQAHARARAHRRTRQRVPAPARSCACRWRSASHLLSCGRLEVVLIRRGAEAALCSDAQLVRVAVPGAHEHECVGLGASVFCWQSGELRERDGGEAASARLGHAAFESQCAAVGIRVRRAGARASHDGVIHRAALTRERREAQGAPERASDRGGHPVAPRARVRRVWCPYGICAPLAPLIRKG